MSESDWARGRVGDVHASAVCTPLLYEWTSFTGEGGHSYIVVSGAVVRLSCTGGATATGAGVGWPLAVVANSEVAVLNSPALRTLFGRLPLRAGDAAPPFVDPGRLSPTKLLIKVSISRRFSARPGMGDTSYYFNQSVVPAQRRNRHTSPGLPVLCRLAVAWLARSSLCRLSSASLAFFARISSRRCCILTSLQSHRGICQLCVMNDCGRGRHRSCYNNSWDSQANWVSGLSRA